MNRFRICFLFSLLTSILLSSCGGGGADGEMDYNLDRGNAVKIHELADPDQLNPINSTSANSTYVQGNIFQTLLSRDPETLKLTGLVAVGRPVITAIEEGEYAGGMSIAYEIRPEARWDNNTPITAHDVVFTIKTLKNPHVNAQSLRPYYEFIHDVIIDPADPKKFTYYSKDRYMLAEEFSGYWVLPEYHYDPNQLMRKYTMKQLNDPAMSDRIKSDSDMLSFAREFNHEKYQREQGFIVGSGPYNFVSWQTGQRITLERKQNWWGDEVPGGLREMQAYPERIIYEIINDWTTAVTAMRDQQIDVASGIQPKQFVDLQRNDRFKSRYNLFSPIEFSYVYIGMNMRSPKLNDVRVRKALAHLIDKNQIINIINYGLAEETIGPIHPTKAYYNKNLRAYDYSIETARNLLREAGWVDTDNDGILDKVIDGRKIPLKLEFMYNSGNEIRKSVGLIFKENARRVGIDVDVIAKEWTVFIDLTKSHQFETFCGGWISGPGLDDPKQIWHTTSYDGGSNYVGFGTAESDALIDSLRIELDENNRNRMYARFQEIVHEEVPYVFLYTPKGRLSIHKRWDNAEAMILRPGYNEKEWRLRTSHNQAQAFAK